MNLDAVAKELAIIRERLETCAEELVQGSCTPFEAAGTVHSAIKPLLNLEQQLRKGVPPPLTIAEKAVHEVFCPYCHKAAEFVDSAEVYGGRSYGMIWLCRPCEAYVGCHPDGKPLGRLADAELRQWKKNAHAWFDPLWKDGTMSRGKAYKWLCEAMSLPGEACHIGKFDVNQCKQVVAAIAEFRGKKVRT